jgi:hypothetical protein
VCQVYVAVYINFDAVFICIRTSVSTQTCVHLEIACEAKIEATFFPSKSLNPKPLSIC